MRLVGKWWGGGVRGVIGMPARLAGLEALRGGQRHIRQLWRAWRAHHCPMCCQGVLACRPRQDGWEAVCPSCGYGVQAADEPGLRQVLATARAQTDLQQLAGLDQAQRDALWRRHRHSARWLFGLAGLLFVGGLLLIAGGAAWLYPAHWWAISLLFGLQGMKRSYLAWLVQTGRLYDPQAFGDWLRAARWRG